MTSSALRLTFAFLASFFILTLLEPYLFLAIVFWTFGLAAPLLLLNTVLIYFVAAWPALAATRTRPYDWRLVACSAVLIPLVAVVPPLISEMMTLKHVQGLRSGDVSMAFPQTPKSIEVAGERHQATSFLVGPDDAPCQEFCQRLLLSRQVDVVRVMNAKGVSGSDYHLEQRDSCPDAFDSTRLMLPRTKDALVSGTCLVAVEADATPTAARIEFRKTSFPEPQTLAQDFSRMADLVKTIEVVTISTAEQGRWSEQLRNTRVTFSYWAMPLIVHLRVRPVERTLDDVDLDQVALKALAIDEPDSGQQMTPAERVMALLGHSGRSLTRNQSEIVGEWVRTFPSCEPGRCPPLAREQEEIVTRLAAERRAGAIAQLAARNPDIAADHLDLLLEEMLAQGANSSFSNALGPIIARLDIETLRARRDVLLTLVRKNDWTRAPTALGLGILAGRLGIDTSDLIAERLKRRESAVTAAMAACMADAALGQELVPALRDYLRTTTDRGFPDRYAIEALIRFGHFDEVKDVTRAVLPKLAERYSRAGNEADLTSDISLCDPE